MSLKAPFDERYAVSSREGPANKRRIALVVPSFADAGGVPAVAEFLLRTIRSRPDFEVRIISLATSSHDPTSLLVTQPSTWLGGPTTREAIAHGERYTHVGAVLGEFEFQRMARRRLLDRALAGCDLIQVVSGTPAWALTVAGTGRPVVLQTATLARLERRARARRERGFVGFWRAGMTAVTNHLDDVGLRRADAVMVENPWMFDYCRTQMKDRETSVVYAPPGVDTRLFKPNNASGVRSGTPYVLAVGRFADTRKNAPLLLASYEKLCSMLGDPPALIIAGATGPDEAFWTRAEASGVRRNIRYIQGATREEIAQLYRDALCLVVPSDEEGFGLVVIEAMASGTPVVSTRCGGPDGIITDGRDGFLVDLDDADAMADRVARLVADQEFRDGMGRRALDTVLCRYSDEAAGAVYLETYDRLLEEQDDRLKGA